MESRLLHAAQASGEPTDGEAATATGPSAPPHAGALSKEEQEFIKALNEVSRSTHCQQHRLAPIYFCTVLLSSACFAWWIPCQRLTSAFTIIWIITPHLLPPPPPTAAPQDLSRFNDFFMSAEENAVINLQALLDAVGAALGGLGGGNQEVLRGLMAQLVDFHGEAPAAGGGRGGRQGQQRLGGSGTLGSWLLVLGRTAVWC